jgi:hypothetical protein
MPVTVARGDSASVAIGSNGNICIEALMTCNPCPAGQWASRSESAYRLDSRVFGRGGAPLRFASGLDQPRRTRGYSGPSGVSTASSIR